MAAQQLESITAHLSPSEYLTSDHPDFAKEITPWSLHADLRPSLLVTPSTISTLQTVMRSLYSSNLDFAVRTTGTGCSSARDVILSTTGCCKEFAFDAASETVTLGSGLTWGEVDKLMEEQAEGYAVVGARCPYVGVGGSILAGGLSWLSHEYGMISDPQNMLDAHVILHDGRVIWASSEPDLLWGLRGGGGNFGVVTAFKLKAYRYTSSIFSGFLNFPVSALPDVSAGVSAFAARLCDPKMAMHVFSFDAALGFGSMAEHPNIGVLLYDAHGEEHARSSAGFKWILDLPGAAAETGVMPLRQVHALAIGTGDGHGKGYSFMSAPLISDIDEKLLVRAWRWRANTVKANPALAQGTFVLLEFMQENAFNSSPNRHSTAWPHSGRKHVLQLGAGYSPSDASNDLRTLALQRLSAAADGIVGQDKMTGEYLPGFLHEWNDMQEVFKDNWTDLRRVKGKYDPLGKFNKGLFIPPPESTGD